MPTYAADGLSVTAEAFLAQCRADCVQARRAIDQLRAMTAPRDPGLALEAYDGAMQLIGDAGARASVCRNAHPDVALRDAADSAEQEIEALATEISLDRFVYDALSAVAPDGLDDATQHYLKKTLRDMRRAGVDRDEATRVKVKQLREELVRIGQEFGKNITEDVRALALEPAQLAGLPEDWRAAHAPGPDGKVRVSTDNPDYVPFVSYADDAGARSRLWFLYRQRAHPKNLDVLARMLARRHELATLLGYASWAAYVTEDKMIGTAEAVADFIAKVAVAGKTRGERDYARLLARKQRDTPAATRVDPWDTGYLEKKLGVEEYGFDAQKMREYFEYHAVKGGVLAVTARLFGVKYRAVGDAAVWHPEVEVYDVVDAATGAPLGRVYLDMHPREGKYKHYAQFTLASGVAGKRLPEGVLMCNFPPPRGDQPALLEHDQVRTFFHEFGHLLHHVLGGHTRWVGLSGVATEWDFVEAPSQMLEEWVWDLPTLQSFAHHFKTGEPIPAELIERARAADEFGKGMWVRQQMFYAAVSFEYHRRAPGSFDLTRLMAELQAQHTSFEYQENSYFHESFGHLDGYSAIYYTYMWSLVIAKDMFAQFLPVGLGPSEVARRYRRSILEPGGSKPAAKLVEDFLGRPYGYQAFQSWLDKGAA